MKNIFCLAIIFLLVSCAPKDNEILSKKVIIAGRVTNYNPNISKLSIGINRIGLRQEKALVTIDSSGYFKSSFESYVPTDVWIMVNTNFLVLTHPGDSIYVEFDGTKETRPDLLKQIKFTGSASDQNQKAAIFQQMYFSSSLYSDWDKKELAVKEYDEKRYKLYKDSVRQEETNLLQRFIKENNPSEETKNWAKIYLDAEYYRDLLEYPNEHRRANSLKRNEWNVSEGYFDFLKDRFPINMSTIISGYSINGFVNSYNAFYVFELIQDGNKQFFNSLDFKTDVSKTIDSITFYGEINNIQDPLLRQIALTEILFQNLQHSDIRMFEKYKNEIRTYITEPYLEVPLFKLYDETKSRLDSPKIASDAILLKLNESPLTSNIDSIIKANKGKVIYMDCWATWCGPCLSEMPDSKTLMEELKGKEVAFIYICLESEEKQWKSILSKFGIAGQHVLLSTQQSSDLREIFDIEGIPYYILFDKSGNISEKNTLPPNAIKEKIEKLLDKQK